MPGVRGATPPCDDERSHSKGDFLADLECQLKKRLETTPHATASKHLMPPARQPPPFETTKPTPPPKPTQTAAAEGQ